MQALCGCKWYKVLPRICYVFLCNQYMYKSSETPFNTGSSGIPDSWSPIFLYQVSQPCFGEGAPSPRTSAAIRAGKVVLEGGRKVYVVLTTFVGPDPELYMTEYAAISIVFTLQGLYTCTHSPRIRPGTARPSPRHQSTKLTATAPSCSRFGARPPARGRPGL